MLKKKDVAENKREKNAFLLVLPIEEISLQPELSSSARFRIPGGTLIITDGGGRRTDQNPCV